MVPCSAINSPIALLVIRLDSFDDTFLGPSAGGYGRGSHRAAARAFFHVPKARFAADSRAGSSRRMFRSDIRTWNCTIRRRRLNRCRHRPM
jgi:hypothetical protein